MTQWFNRMSAALQAKMLQTKLQQVFVKQRKAWLFGFAGYLLFWLLNVLSAWLLPVPAPLADEPALRWQLQQTDASLAEINAAIDKLAERKALFEQ